MSYGPPTGGYYPPPGGGGNQPPTGGYPPPGGGQPPQQGMSTGAKVGLFGCGGCLLLVVLGFVVLMALGAFVTTSSSETGAGTPIPAEETGAAAEQADGVVMTAAHAGTAGDTIDDTVYTVIDIEIINNGDTDLEVNPLYFSVTLEDGTVVSEWADTLFADIDHLDAVTLRPGERATGQIAVVGEADVASVRMEELMGMGQEITAAAPGHPPPARPVRPTGSARRCPRTRRYVWIPRWRG